MDKISWNMVSTEQIEPNFDSSLLSETTFVIPTQSAEKAKVSFQNVQNLNQQNTLDFRDSQVIQGATEKTCQSNNTYMYN